MRRNGVARWFQRRPVALDAALAAFVLTLELAGVFVSERVQHGITFRDPDAIGVLLVVVSGVALVWRRRAPFATLVVATVASGAYEMAGYPPFGHLGVLLALYTVAAYSEHRRRSIQAFLFTVAVLTAVFLTARWHVGAGTVVTNAVVASICWTVGDSLRTRRRYLAALEERADRLEREQQVAARQAVADERSRIARELHDVVAHNVSVMVVQAGAARRTLGRDPAKASEAMASIESTGRQALTEMRRLLGVLRPTDEAVDSRAPQPSVARLDDLVAQVRASGLPVDVVVEGDPRPLPSGVDLSAFRIVQEALTNTLKHGGRATARVVVRYRSDDLELEVTDDGRGLAVTPPAAVGNGSGHGQVGMRERVNLFGGSLHVGPLGGGGYQVRARLPLDPARS